jgi:hypothetical protein
VACIFCMPVLCCSFYLYLSILLEFFAQVDAKLYGPEELKSMKQMRVSISHLFISFSLPYVLVKEHFAQILEK